MVNAGRRTAAHLDTILCDVGRWPDTDDFVVANDRGRSCVVDDNAALLIQIDQVIEQRGAADLTFTAAADQHTHSVLTSAKRRRCASNLGDVVSVNRRRTGAID